MMSKTLFILLFIEGDVAAGQPLAKSVNKRFGRGCSSKPSGKLALSEIRSLPRPPSHNVTVSDPDSPDLSLASLAPGALARGVASGVLVSGSSARGAAPTHLEGYKGRSRAVTSSVLSEPTPPAELTFSFTDSDLLSDNSHLKTSFPSLPSSTQTSVSLSNQQQPALSGSGMASNTFVSAGAGPHCPQPPSDSDSSLIQRVSRGRLPRLKHAALTVLGRNFSIHALSALRMAFKSYPPAVALTQVNLKGPIFKEDAAEMERFAHAIMDSGEVDRAEDLFILCEVLHFAHDVLKKVLSRETEVSCYLPAQIAADFAPNGPVMCDLRKVIEEVEKLEEEHQSEVLAAEFDEHSFQMDNSTLTDGETHAPAKEVQVEVVSSKPGELREPVKERPAELGEPVKKRPGQMGEPAQKRSRSSLEDCENADQEPCSVFLEEGLKKPAALKKTLAESGAAALNRFQK